MPCKVVVDAGGSSEAEYIISHLTDGPDGIFDPIADYEKCGCTGGDCNDSILQFIFYGCSGGTQNNWVVEVDGTDYYLSNSMSPIGTYTSDGGSTIEVEVADNCNDCTIDGTSREACDHA